MCLENVSRMTSLLKVNIALAMVENLILKSATNEIDKMNLGLVYYKKNNSKKE